MNIGSSLTDTIVARATASGAGAIGIVRLSGKRSLEIAGKIAPAWRPKPRHLCLARLEDGEGRPLDEGLAVWLPQPRSYTGEDTVELHVHGAPVVVQSVVDCCLLYGARLAEPGEFTLRAFLNGRMSLEQAEAVGDLIQSQDARQHRGALRRLGGEFSDGVGDLLERAERVVVQWQAALDFPDHDSGEGWSDAHVHEVAEIAASVGKLRRRCRLGLQGRRQVVLCGAPNVGKSTLLNALVGEERVLVSDEPGTTRDPVPADMDGGSWKVPGTFLTLWDTAGIRSEAEALEARGVELTHRRAAEADSLVWILDPLDPRWPRSETTPDWVIANKADVCDPSARASLEAAAGDLGMTIHAWISARDRTGLEELVNRLAGVGHDSELEPETDLWLVRERHLVALDGAAAALDRVGEGFAQKAPLDLLHADLTDAARYLGHILGRDVDASVLDRIFADFCIGK